MAYRRGMGRGKGKGYYNIINKDKKVHSDSAKGKKQPQEVKSLKSKDPEDMSWEEIKQKYGEITADDLQIKGLMSPMIEGYNIDYTFDEFGNVVYSKGLGHTLKELGAEKLSEKEALKLLSEEEKEKYKEAMKKGNKQEADEIFEDALNRLQNDNTYNYGPALGNDYNFGFLEKDGNTYFIFKKHTGEDIRVGYTDSVVYDISELDLGATGEPKGDMTVLLNPEVEVIGNIHGKTYDFQYLGDMAGIEYPESDAPRLDDDKLIEKMENFAQNNYGNKGD